MNCPKVLTVVIREGPMWARRQFHALGEVKQISNLNIRTFCQGQAAIFFFPETEMSKSTNLKESENSVLKCT